MENVVDVLFDSTVVLGAQLGDASHKALCGAALALAEDGALQGWICSHSLREITETLAKALGPMTARRELAGLRSYLRFADTREDSVDAALDRALSARGPALEDALLMEDAASEGMEYIVTLNAEDFAHSRVPAVTPQQLLDRFQPETGAA